MKRFILAFLFIVNMATASAQYTGYNSNDSWSKFSLQALTAQPIPNADTCLVFVSNRHILADSLRFVDESLDTTALKYFFLQKLDGKWNVYKASSLSDAMEHLPYRKDIVVYAEGMGKVFTSNVARAQLMSAQYNVNVVMFDYASTNSTYKPSKNFRFARSNARNSAAQYLSLLKEIRQARVDDAPWLSGLKLSTFYHSMGNIILEKMVQEHDISSINQEPFIDNLILNAACVPMKEHSEWVEKIKFAKQIYVHYNRTDIQLKGAHLLTMKRQLGEKITRRQEANGVVYVNFHELVGFKHSYFMNFPYSDFKLPQPLVDYFSKLLTGKDLTSQELSTMMATKKDDGMRM